METRAGKRKRIDNESKGRLQTPSCEFSTTRRRGKPQRLLNETVEQNEASCNTTLYTLPLEVLDIILQKSHLHWILTSPTKQRDEEVISSLRSVDVCFYQRITRQQFKNAIWRYLKEDCKRQKIETFEQNEDPSNTTMTKAVTSQETTETEEKEISRLGMKTLRSKDTEFTENLQKKDLMASTTDKIKLRTILDFDPKQMNLREKGELNVICKRIRVTEQRSMLDQNERHRHRFKKFDMRKHGEIEYDKELSDHLREFGLSRQDEQINSEDELRELKVKVYDRRQETSDIEDQEEANKTEYMKTMKLLEEFIKGAKEMNTHEAQSECESEIESESESDWESASYDSDESDSEYEADLYAVALPFKRGDKLETIPAEYMSDMDRWLMARHLDNGKIGFISRNRFVMETNHQPSRTTLYTLPLEMFDIILQKSYLHWILNLSKKKRDEEVIRSLISVDVSFYQRISRKRFKKAIWRHLKYFYGKTTKKSAIIRNNRNYLLENIQPNYDLIASLLSLNCITEEQRNFIQRQRSTQDKNAELLYVIEPFDETKFSNFVKCLRQTNQKTVARIIENGGAAIKIEVQTDGAKCTSIETQLLHTKIEDLQTRTKRRSHQTDKLSCQLREEGIEILSSQPDRQTLVVWIWCRSQAALEHIQKLYESNRLRDVFFENIQPSISIAVNIDENQFKKIIVVCPISINFTQRIKIGGNEDVRVVTKLRNEIYVLYESVSASPSSIHIIRVFEDRIPFRLQKTIDVKEIKHPRDIGSSDKGNCLYVSDSKEKCVWKITRETDDQHKIIKWLTTGYHPFTLSVSTDGQLLVVNQSSSILRIYGSDAELIRSIQLPRDIKRPIHAAETSIGNFIILHEWLEEDKGESGLSGEESGSSVGDWKWNIHELTRDGQMVICRFIPSNETQQLNEPRYLSLDSDDQMFVADRGNGRVILLDSDLKWNRILCPTKEETEETKILRPRSLCYDEEKKQLIVGGLLGEVYVYTLSRN